MRVAVISLRGASADEVVELLSGHEVGPRLEVDDAAGLGDDGRAQIDADVIVVVTGRFGQPLLDLLSALHRVETGRTLVVCDRIGSSEVRMLLVSGAMGLVLGGHAQATLLATLEAVHAGQLCLPPRHAGAARGPNLSQRERQVIGLVAMGLTNREIADRLYLVESTVKSHLTSAFQKLGVRSRSEAVDLIVDPAFGLSVGVLSLGATPIDRSAAPS